MAHALAEDVSQCNCVLGRTCVENGRRGLGERIFQPSPLPPSREKEEKRHRRSAHDTIRRLQDTPLLGAAMKLADKSNKAIMSTQTSSIIDPRGLNAGKE